MASNFGESVVEGSYVSTALGRIQPYWAFLPEQKGRSSLPLLVLLHGQGGSYRDWFTETRILRYLAHYAICVVCPQGDAGWYTDAHDGSAAFETDLIECLIPHLQQRFPLAPPGRSWAIGGLSMGGYGAVKIALRHYSLFSTALSHSGAFDVTQTPEVHPVFGDPVLHRSFRKKQSAFFLAEEALCRRPHERSFLHLDCGLEDEHLDANRRFHGYLNFIGYGHEYMELPGFHTWPYWDRAFRTALPWLLKRLNVEEQET